MVKLKYDDYRHIKHLLTIYAEHKIKKQSFQSTMQKVSASKLCDKENSNEALNINTHSIRKSGWLMLSIDYNKYRINIGVATYYKFQFRNSASKCIIYENTQIYNGNGRLFKN